MVIELEAALVVAGQALQPDKCAWLLVGSVPMTAKITPGGQDLPRREP